MSNASAAAIPLGRPWPVQLDANSVWRRLTVKPAMCGPHATFIAQAGDWTWDSVSALCQMDVFKARDPNGAPVYLSFYYFHIQATPALHTGCIEFGDQIDVTSSAFNFGSESILVLHRISRNSSPDSTPVSLTAKEFYESPRSGSIYVQTFNRWISRRSPETNVDLVRSSPAEFAFSHLPALPETYSPRSVYTKARMRRTFHELHSGEMEPFVGNFRFTYRVDVTRDVNAAGLLYFAAYFALIDRAVLEMWRKLGRKESSFLRRIILDEKVCYVGNANADAELAVEVTSWKYGDGQEVVNAVVEDADGNRVIAIGTVRLLYVA